jgi:hypothetical protein
VGANRVGDIARRHPSLTNLPVVVRTLPAGQRYTFRSLSNVKSSRLKVPSSRFDLSITGMCGAIFFSLRSSSASPLSRRPYPPSAAWALILTAAPFDRSEKTSLPGRWRW